jgi:hypothetical protein
MIRRLVTIMVLVLAILRPALAGENEIRSAQATIAAQIEAFLADDDARAYSFAAPNIKQRFPTLESFMNMVESGYPMVRAPQSYAFGKVQELDAKRIVQQVLIVGPDGRNYEAIYTLELQPDGVHRITGVSLRASNALTT